MTAIELGSLILAVEFGLIAWLTILLSLRRKRDQWNADQQHAGAVMETLKGQEGDRRDALATLFATTYNLEGGELSAKVEEYIEREQAFYSAMVSLYLDHDGARLQEIPAELAKVLTPWSHMTPRGMVRASEVGNLQGEKDTLALELSNTKRTLEQLMEEYMAAFSKHEQAPPSTPAPVSAATEETEETAPGEGSATPEKAAPEVEETQQFDILAEQKKHGAGAPGAPTPATDPPTEALAVTPPVRASRGKGKGKSKGTEAPTTTAGTEAEPPRDGNPAPLQGGPEARDAPPANDELEGLEDLFSPSSPDKT